MHIRTERAALQFRMSTSYHEQTFGTDVRVSLRSEVLPPCDCNREGNMGYKKVSRKDRVRYIGEIQAWKLSQNGAAEKYGVVILVVQDWLKIKGRDSL